MFTRYCITFNFRGKRTGSSCSTCRADPLCANFKNFLWLICVLEGREVLPSEFWDVVVLTAVDVDQREAYELQISEKVDRKELPIGIHYKVFSDPPGSKIGKW